MKLNEKYSLGLLDFHTHSNVSDGSRTPSEVVEDAKSVGVSALALTDHNLYSGLEEFKAACSKHDILAIPFGEEISAEVPGEILKEGENETPDFIILGKNPNLEPIKEHEKFMMDFFREEFFPVTIRGLESVGFKIPEGDYKAQHERLKTQLEAPPKLFADCLKYPWNTDALVKYIRSIDASVTEQEIRGNPFGLLNIYLFTKGQPAYCKKIANFNVADARKLTDAMNCSLFIAHPGGRMPLSDAVLDYSINNGARGLEVRNYWHSAEQNDKFDELALRRGLIRGGGSDYHGPIKKNKLGMHDLPRNQLPKDILDELWDNLPG
jgi:3',5'-nucleoside bisphosphate phosphatase